MSTYTIPLNPLPGFCLKSKTLKETVASSTATSLLLSPNTTSSDALGIIPKGLKIFINIAWDTNVPPPPPGSEDAVQKAMRGQDFDDGWFVPVILSDLRDDKDKAGHPALVIDCVFNTSLKSRTLKDPDFKAFIIELALQRVEAHTSLLLSRQISTPNIASKGKPQSRQVLVPGPLFPPGHPHHKSDSKTNLIQELETPTVAVSAPKPKAILKSTPITHTPTWSWTLAKSRISIMINVPNLTHADIRNSTLDVEPRQVILRVPSLYNLVIDLDAPDVPGSRHGALGEETIELKNLRDLDVDGASAEWRVAEKVIVLLA